MVGQLADPAQSGHFRQPAPLRAAASQRAAAAAGPAAIAAPSGSAPALGASGARATAASSATASGPRRSEFVIEKGEVVRMAQGATVLSRATGSSCAGWCSMAIMARRGVEAGEGRRHDRAIERLEPRLVQNRVKADRAAGERDGDRSKNLEGLTKAEPGLHASSIPAWTTSSTFPRRNPASAG